MTFKEVILDDAFWDRRSKGLESKGYIHEAQKRLPTHLWICPWEGHDLLKTKEGFCPYVGRLIRHPDGHLESMKEPCGEKLITYRKGENGT